jgi:hypothetical protein
VKRRAYTADAESPMIGAAERHTVNAGPLA